MINILLDTLDFSADFLYEQLKRYIHPEDKVAVLAFPIGTGMSAALQTGMRFIEKETGFIIRIWCPRSYDTGFQRTILSGSIIIQIQNPRRQSSFVARTFFICREACRTG